MNHIRPEYYNRNGICPLDIIDAFDLNFNKGNVIKYVCRAGKKDPSKTIEDLKKAREYLDREIKKLETLSDLLFMI